MLITASIVALFGLAENYSNWLFIPKKCYKFDNQTGALKEDKNSKYFCIEHVYLPYQPYQGSVKLGISSRLSDGSYLYTLTTFWVAKDLGEAKFSDVKGDFTTDEVRIYNKYGVKIYNKLDVERPDKTAPYPINKFIKYCETRAIFLNGLFMRPECLENQQLVWQEVQAKAPTVYTNYSKPLSKFILYWISGNTIRVVAAMLIIFALVKLYPIAHSNNFRNSEIEKRLSRKLLKDKLKQSYVLLLELAIYIAIVGGVGFAINNTIYLIPGNILCLNEDKVNHKVKAERVKKVVYNVCINEIMAPYNSYRGEVVLGVKISYTDLTKVVSETTMFVSDQDTFQDASGDMMHSKISYYNRSGILENRSSDLIGEEVAKLMPNNVNNKFWLLVKDKLAEKKEIMYVSAQRVLGKVIEDSLPFLFAAYAVLYSYSLYLALIFSDVSTKEKNEEDD